MSLEEFTTRSRPALLHKMTNEELDLVIVGGGITGASIFRDAALRGMRVGLVEAKDFASGTSGRSSKMIHGGLRYLQHLGLGVARESCRERNLHITLNKRLVHPMPFLIPLYDGQKPGAGMLRLGMWLYEALSSFRNARIHRFLSREETLRLCPGLPAEGLSGGCLYYDASVSDNRWTLEIIKDGVRNGGIAVNYAPAVRLIEKNGRCRGVTARDSLGGETYNVHARAVVNATGVFADTIRQMDDPSARPLIRLSKGTHLVFREEDVPLTVTTAFTSALDGRPLFLAKHERAVLLGTTDAWVDQDPGEPRPAQDDVDYLLRSVQLFMPAAGLTAGKVQFVYSGFRPLLAIDHGENPADATREDYIETSRSGLISVVGGKLTTARIMALRVLAKVVRQTGKRFPRSRTHELSIGGTNLAVAESLADWVKRDPPLTWYFTILFDRYGLDAGSICQEAMRIHEGRHPDKEAEPIRAEVEYVCRREMVCTVEDLVERRAGFLDWSSAERLQQLRRGKHVISRELGLTEQQFEEQFTEYQRFLATYHSVPEGKEVP